MSQCELVLTAFPMGNTSVFNWRDAILSLIFLFSFRVRISRVCRVRVSFKISFMVRIRILVKERGSIRVSVMKFVTKITSHVSWPSHVTFSHASVLDLKFKFHFFLPPNNYRDTQFISGSKHLVWSVRNTFSNPVLMN